MKLRCAIFRLARREPCTWRWPWWKIWSPRAGSRYWQPRQKASRPRSYSTSGSWRSHERKTEAGRGWKRHGGCARCGRDSGPGRRRAISNHDVRDEPTGNYNRILLSGVLNGSYKEEEIFLNPLSWYDENGIRLLAGQRAAGLLRRAK